ncbi:MAG: DUF4012 domain-containing protein, partial [Patescibacteria group bacterium]
EKSDALVGDSVYKLTRAMFGTENLETITIGVPELPPVILASGARIPDSAGMTPRKKWPFILIPILILFIFILLPILSLLTNGFLGVQALRTARDQALRGEFAIAALSTASAESSFGTARGNLLQIAPVLKILYLSGFVNTVDRFLSLARLGAQTGTELLTAAGRIWPLPDNWLANLPQIAKDLTQADINLGFIEARMPDPRIREARSLLAFAGNILPQVPDLAGQSARKSYLVLLQNNAELRPTGGFIGAYAIVDFEDGKLLSYKINDIYTADGQLRGRVAPPDEILHFLGQPDWFMRDSNFSPDFSLSAQRAAWFLEKSTGQKVDGVIGIDMYFIQKLLKNFGPLELTDFNDTVTAENFFEKAEYQAEIDFFPGSTKKKDYLSAVGQAMLDKTTVNSKVAQAVYESLNERHLQIYFNNSAAQEAVAGQNWAGDLKFTGDNYLDLAEDNFGANKANYFVKREIFLQEDVAKTGEIDTTVTINYQNTSPGDAWPGGRYKNYLRLFVPPAAQFLSANLGDGRTATMSAVLDETVLKKITSNQFLIFKSTESGSLNFGMLVEIPAASKKTVSFTYRLPTPAGGEHRIFVRKQAGTDADKLTVIANGPKIKYNNTTDLSVDRTFIWKKQP